MRLPGRIVAYVFAILIVFTFGITGTYILGSYKSGFNVKITSLVEAAYFTVTTVSTVGYGDIVPVTNAARLFVMVLEITGLGVYISAITIVSSELVTARIEKFSGRLSTLERRFLRNHVVLIGTDTVNLDLAEKLKNKNVRYVIMSSDKDMVEGLHERGLRAYLVNETDKEEMKRFEFGRARSIIVDMRNKSRMVYAILVVRSLAQHSKIVVVAHNKDEEKNIRSMSIGVGIINPPDIVSDILAKKIIEL